MNNMKQIGLHADRLPWNPLEKAFADQWEKENSNRKTPFLSHLLFDKGFGIPRDPTQDQIAIAATVIQWLGSPIGQSFLENVLTSCEDGICLVRHWNRMIS